MVSHPRGSSCAEGVGPTKGDPYETFQWSLITMGWRFTFIRPAAKSLVCICSPTLPPSQPGSPHSRCARTEHQKVEYLRAQGDGSRLPSETKFTPASLGGSLSACDAAPLNYERLSNYRAIYARPQTSRRRVLA